MTALAIETVLVQLAHAGLRLSLAPAGGWQWHRPAC